MEQVPPMGAAKFPEQISERTEAGFRDAEKIDPVIERLREQPVERDIKPEESNVHRPLSAGALKGARKISNRIALKQQLQRVYDQIDRLRSSDSTLTVGLRANDEQISSLRRLAGKLRKKTGQSKRSKRSKKRR
jgi:hypothetical protein